MHTRFKILQNDISVIGVIGGSIAAILYLMAITCLRQF